MIENAENHLVDLYSYQFTVGCDQILCDNINCVRCPRFILANSINNPQKIYNYAKLCAQNHMIDNKLCPFLPPHACDEGYKQMQRNFSSFAQQLTNDIKVPTRNLVTNLREGFKNVDTFSNILRANNLPFSTMNPNIDEEILFEFSNKISCNPHISAALLDCVFAIAEELTNSPNLINNSYSKVRALLLLFYFPVVITPRCSKSILDPLLSIFAKCSTKKQQNNNINNRNNRNNRTIGSGSTDANDTANDNNSTLSKHTIHLVVSWISQLNVLRRQMVGACHFSISMYFATTARPNIHSDQIKMLIDAMSIFHESNSLSEDPLQPLLFYNHHIDEVVKIKDELEHRHDSSDRYPSLLSRPFILSLKTKASMCQSESQNLMVMVAFRTFFNEVVNSTDSNGRATIQTINMSDLYLTLHIRRAHLLEDALNQLSAQNAFSFLKRMRVVFEGESAVDVGGPSRELLYLISEALFSPDYGMFTLVNNNKYNWFSRFSFENNRSYYLVGAVVGLALYNSIVLPIRFPLVVYKRLLTPTKQLSIADLVQVDPDLARGLRQILEMAERGDNIADLGLTFSVTVENFDRTITLPLLEGLSTSMGTDTTNEVDFNNDTSGNVNSGIINGNNWSTELEVTNENAELYVDSYVNFVLITSVKDHFECFRKGFDLTCRVPSYRLLEPEEIDILVSGEEVLDWGALQRCAAYSGGYGPKSRPVRWFWDLFHTKFTNDEKLKFLKFATGTDRAPVGGLGSMKLVIQRGADPNRLPISHTCFNTFTLPDYKSRKTLEERVTMAIQQNEGFGIV